MCRLNTPVTLPYTRYQPGNTSPKIATMKFQIKLFYICCIGVTMSGFTACGKKGSSPKPTPPVDTGKTVTKNFTVQYSKIFDPDGHKNKTKNIIVNGPYWPWDRPTIPDVPLITDVWM